jgi:YidC/Oxa1 family membrane protein insertase
MDKRFFLALLLTGVVVVVTPMVFPPDRPVPVSTAPTSGPSAPVAPAPGVASVPDVPASLAAPQATIGTAGDPSAPAPVVPETLALGNALTTFRFSSAGASFVSADLPAFRKLGGREGSVQLAHGREAMLRYRLLAGGDTIPLDQVSFQATMDSVAGRPRATFTGALGTARIGVTYTLAEDNYLADVSFRAEGLPQPAFLLTDLPTGFTSQEADTTEDHRHLAYAMKPEKGGAMRVDFRKPDPGELMLQPGPITWAVAKSKYFLVGVLAPRAAPRPSARCR